MAREFRYKDVKNQLKALYPARRVLVDAEMRAEAASVLLTDQYFCRACLKQDTCEPLILAANAIGRAVAEADVSGDINAAEELIAKKIKAFAPVRYTCIDIENGFESIFREE